MLHWVLLPLRLAFHLPSAVKLNGLIRVSGLGLAYLREGRGISRFTLWCREQSAYLHRMDANRYQAWLRGQGHPASTDGGMDAFTTLRFPIDNQRKLADVALDIDARWTLLQPDGVDVEVPATLIDFADAQQAAIVYFDEDRQDASGRCKPFFKPAFSLDLLLDCDYIGPCILVSSKWLNASLTGSGQRPCSVYALLLEAAETGAGICRYPGILASWSFEREQNLTADQRAIAEAFTENRYGQTLAKVFQSGSGSSRALLANHTISLIIPTRDGLQWLEKCLATIEAGNEHLSTEIIIVDNQSQDPETHAWLKRQQKRLANLKVIAGDYSFNWSKLNNQAANEAEGDLLIFLNNDIEADDPDWIEHLALHTLREESGVVAPLLLYPNGEIQHAGVVIGIGGLADHVYACTPADPGVQHQFISPFRRRNMTVCTGACIATTKAKFLEVGGFNEALTICGDIDFCLRMIEAGYTNIYEPQVKLTHHESATRSKAPLPQREIDTLMPLIGKYLETGDPSYNPNLRLDVRYPSCHG